MAAPISVRVTATSDVSTVSRVDLLVKLTANPDSTYAVVASDTSASTVGYLVNGAAAVGPATIVADAGTAPILAGDIVTFGSSPIPYRLTAGIIFGTTTSSFIITPILIQAVADNTAINCLIYDLAWTPTAAGSYTIKARTVDGGGAATDSTEVVVTIINKATAQGPVVTFTTPASNFIKERGASQTLTVTATGQGGKTIQRVDFNAGNLLLASATTAPFSFNWTVPTNQALGNTVITATAIDSAGLTTDATLIATITDATARPPTVTLAATSTAIKLGEISNVTATATLARVL